MSYTKLKTLFKDSITITLTEKDLTKMKVGKVKQSLAYVVPHSNGLMWWINYYPAGNLEESKNHLSIFVNVNKAVPTTYSFRVGNSSIIEHSSNDFVETKSYGLLKLASHEQLRPLFVDGKISITCEAEFDIPVPFTFVKPCYGQFCDHLLMDLALVVDSKQIQVHKSVLSFMSPVFHAMLSHDTDETVNGEVEIKDFDFETVKGVIDFCYGREPETAPVETVFNMLRFAEQYDMKAITNLVEKMPQFCISIQTFIAVIQYADKYYKNGVFNECCKFFKEHQKDVVKLEKFATLAPPLVARLLKQAFNLKTEINVLRHAHTNGITFILDQLEQPVRNFLSLGTFCYTVSYAWDCSRDNLKRVCAQFSNEHLAEIVNMKAFVELSPTIIQELMKLRCELPLENRLLQPLNPKPFIARKATTKTLMVIIPCIVCLVTKTIAIIFHNLQ